MVATASGSAATDVPTAKPTNGDYSFTYDDMIHKAGRVLRGSKDTTPQWCLQIIARKGRSDMDPATAIWDDGIDWDIPGLTIEDLKYKRMGKPVPSVIRKRPAAASLFEGTHFDSQDSVRLVWREQKRRTADGSDVASSVSCVVFRCVWPAFGFGVRLSRAHACASHSHSDAANTKASAPAVLLLQTTHGKDTQRCMISVQQAGSKEAAVEIMSKVAEKYCDGSKKSAELYDYRNRLQKDYREGKIGPGQADQLVISDEEEDRAQEADEAEDDSPEEEEEEVEEEEEDEVESVG